MHFSLDLINSSILANIRIVSAIKIRIYFKLCILSIMDIVILEELMQVRVAQFFLAEVLPVTM